MLRHQMTCFLEQENHGRLITMRIIARDVLFILLLAVALALLMNTLRRDGIPLVAKEKLEILVPCPTPPGEATAIAWNDSRVGSAASLLIDVRSKEEFDEWHLPRSVNQPYDWLAEQDEINRRAAEIAKTIAASGKHHVVVYGDGGNPDDGKQWAALLSESGIKNVVYISGGATAMGSLKILPSESE